MTIPSHPHTVAFRGETWIFLDLSIISRWVEGVLKRVQAGMFGVRGQFEVSMDDKGRMPLPARLREALARKKVEALVLTLFDGGVQGYTLSQWKKLEVSMSRLAPLDPKNRAFLVGFMANANETPVDKLGRILVPPPLRRRAGLSKDLVVISYLGWIEVWDLQRWEERLDRAAQEMDRAGGPGEFLVGLDDEGEDTP